jgi:hypothetical protein
LGYELVFSGVSYRGDAVTTSNRDLAGFGIGLTFRVGYGKLKSISTCGKVAEGQGSSVFTGQVTGQVRSLLPSAQNHAMVRCFIIYVINA